MIVLHTLSTDFPSVSVIVQPPSSVLFAPYMHMHDIQYVILSLARSALYSNIHTTWHIMEFRCIMH